MGATSIQWTDHSINPIRARLNGRVGHHCVKVSPGCKHCYSSRLQPRFGLPMFQEQHSKSVETFLDPTKLAEVLRRKKPTKYFWCDMTDMFGEWVPQDWINLCFATMAATPWHTHQVLTKRADRMRDVLGQLYANDGLMLTEAAEQLAPHIDACHIGEDDWKWPLPNVWLGVSAEDQQRADERTPHLLATPAAVRFVSAEPLLGPTNLSRFMPAWFCDQCDAFMRVRGDDGCDPDEGEASPCCSKCGSLRVRHVGLDWIIVGGESGQEARMCDVAWIRAVVEQCRDADVACFVKQLGRVAVEDVPLDPYPDGRPRFGRGPLRLAHKKGGDASEWPDGLSVRQFPTVAP